MDARLTSIGRITAAGQILVGQATPAFEVESADLTAVQLARFSAASSRFVAPDARRRDIASSTYESRFPDGPLDEETTRSARCPAPTRRLSSAARWGNGETDRL